jgi:hypothetical protein
VASLYILLIDLIVPHEHGDRSQQQSRQGTRDDGPPSRPRTPVILDHAYFTHGESGFYFAENGEHTLLSVAQAIGQTMVDAGKATDPEPSPFTQAESQQYFGGVTRYLDSNSRCKADRGKKLGWRPKKTTKELLSSIKQELKG